MAHPCWAPGGFSGPWGSLGALARLGIGASARPRPRLGFVPCFVPWLPFSCLVLGSCFLLRSVPAAWCLAWLRLLCLVPCLVPVPFRVLNINVIYSIGARLGLALRALPAWPFRSAGGSVWIRSRFLVPVPGSGPVFRRPVGASASVFPQSFPQPVDNFSAGSASCLALPSCAFSWVPAFPCLALWPQKRPAVALLVLELGVLSFSALRGPCGSNFRVVGSGLPCDSVLASAVPVFSGFRLG